MKPIGACLLAAGAFALLAQTDADSHKKPSPVYVQDGGVSQALESIFIPPLANAPFSLVLHTEWVQNLPNGGTLTLVNQRRLARQMSGRFYQERWVLVPKNGSVQSQMSHIQIADPNQHTLLTCTMGLNVCALTGYGGVTSTDYQPEEAQSGALPNGQGSVTLEPLGSNTIQGVETRGSRTTRITNAWVIGNDQPFTSTREFWFAPTLGINLVSKISDPRFGSQTFTVTDLTLTEPEPQIFEVPEGFVVQDRRIPANSSSLKP